ncbi:extracellular solute-binding protein [Anoxybacillus sp. CHMUD]|uniref:extracellular solute-binding protein n=1 Tax=Anoxybacillus sp. CHMUD TaxID=2508870 RepID=UPI0014923A23|nr:extracellular solute-binding protein [Anoxybacillus sp. CHMUD]NNU91418.1 extracellular solute-binding protein [Anoxybacillus sp. CHMUD]
MKKPFKLMLSVITSLLLVFLAACGSSNEQTSQPEQDTENEQKLTGKLVVYSSRNENFVDPLLNKFKEETGVEVLALHGVEPLQLIEEAGNVQADIFISNDVGALEYLRMKGILEGFDAKGAETIDAQFRAEDNAWIALSVRARGFIYNKDLISEEEMPKTMEELMDLKWAGQFAITRGGNGSMIANVSALRHEWGDEKTSQWVTAIKKNAGAIMQGHGDIRRAVGAGEFKFGLVNNYYYHQQLEEPTDNNVGFIYPDQGEGEMGVILNAAGVGLVKGGPNSANAKAFIEWLLKEENQLAFVGESLELPINPKLDPPYKHATKISDLKVQSMPLKELGQYFEDTKALIEKAGLDLELK